MVTERNGSGGTFLDQSRNSTITILDKFGRTDITLTKRTATYNQAGRISGYSKVTSTITGDLQFVTYQDKELLKEGYVKIGDGIFYTIYSSSLNENDEITVDSQNWILTSRIEAETLGQGRIYQAWTCIRKNVN